MSYLYYLLGLNVVETHEADEKQKETKTYIIETNKG